MVKCLYLWGQRFIIQTDHNSLSWLQNFTDPQGQIACWLAALAEYNFTILHRPGLKLCNVDVLSRLPCNQGGRHDPDIIAVNSDTDEEEHNDVTSSVIAQSS